jgi:hypothetical protein
MKIEVIRQEAVKIETPFVVGGCYKTGGEYRILVQNPDKTYAMFDIETGIRTYNFVEEARMRRAVLYMYHYIPNARLVIEA